jgi:hypothetical protein
MQEAAGQAVLGDFNNAEFRHGGVTSRFFRRDGRFMVRTDGPDGKLADFEVKYTFGVTPLQQYLIEFPGGRYQALSIAWDARLDARRAAALVPSLPGREDGPNDPLHWTGIYQNWKPAVPPAIRLTEQGLRRSEQYLQDHFQRDQRVVRGLPRPRLAPSRMGEERSRPTRRTATGASRC